MENRLKKAPKRRLSGAFRGSHRRRFRKFSEESDAKTINNRVWKTPTSYSTIPSYQQNVCFFSTKKLEDTACGDAIL